MNGDQRFWRALIAAWIERGEPTDAAGLPVEVNESAEDAHAALHGEVVTERIYSLAIKLGRRARA